MRGLLRLSGCVTAIVLVLLVGTPGLCQHKEHKRAQRAEIEQLEQQWRQAQLSNNVVEMDHLLAEDFLGITAAGQVVTKPQQLDRMRTRALDITQLEVSDTKIKISGRLAVVTSLARLNGTADGQPLQGYFRYTRVYQRAVGDGWKITNFEATRASNGNTIDSGRTKPHGAGVQASPATAPSSGPASPVAPAFPQRPS